MSPGRPQPAREAVNVSFSLSGGYDEDASTGNGAPAASGYPDGEYSNLDAAVTIKHGGRQFALDAAAASSVRRYPRLDGVLGDTHSAGANLAIGLSQRTTFTATIDGRYASEFRVVPQPLGGETPTPPVDSAAFDSSSRAFGTSAGLTRRLRQGSATLSYRATASDWDATGDRFLEQTAVARIERRIGRAAALRFDYGFRAGVHDVAGARNSSWSHDALAGAERRWQHSRVRQTVVSIGAGPSFYQQTSAAGLAPFREVRAVGTVSISHAVAAGLNVRASYRRGGAFANGQRPANTFAADLRYDLARRVQLLGSAGYADSESGGLRGSSDDRYITAFGSARVQVALTRRLGVFGDGTLYRYDVVDRASLTAPSGRLARRGFRVGLTTWLPLHESR